MIACFETFQILCYKKKIALSFYSSAINENNKLN